MSVLAVAPEVLSADAARVLTEEVKADAAALWAKLLTLYEGGAHTALGYSSWGAYYEAEFGRASSTGYRILEAARAVALIPTHGNGDVPAPSQNAARELVPVLREQPERWLVVPMNVAQALARRAKTEGRTRWIGDGGNHLCALVPFDWFRQ